MQLQRSYATLSKLNNIYTPQPNNSLDRSGGSVFRSMTGRRGLN
jgi:hypothetical protein